MSDKHRRRKQSSSKRFASNGAKFISPATACSRQILNITSAAVNALGKSDHADLAYGTTDSVPLADEMSRGFVELDASKKDLSYQDCLTDEHFAEKSTSSKLFSTESVAAAEKAILIDSNDTDSSTLLPGNSLEKAAVLDLSCSSSSRETSFNGKHRVRIPSRLLREIKSPVERPGLTNHPHEVQVQDSKGKLHSKATPVVIRHQNEPSAWVLRPANTLQMLPEHKSSLPQDPVKVPTSSFDSVHLTTAGNVDGLKIDDKPYEQIASPRDVTYFNKKAMKETDKSSSQQDVSFHKETTVPAVNRELNGAGLQQGDPVSGLIVPSDSTSSGAVTTKVFGLSDKEKSLKDSFLRRQESKGPVKRFVQPTVVSARQEETKEREDESQIKSDNPVATAAAIAAAAASAATAPFLQIQHGLESQISALVSNLQVLHQHQTTAQQQHQLSQELLIQQQIQLRLTKLEEAQKQLLELQKQQAVTYRKAEEQIENKTNSGLSSHRFDEAMNNPTNANIPYSRAPDRMTGGVPSRVSSIPYSSASPFHPHPVSTELVYSHTLPSARIQPSKTEPSLKYTLVKNTKTQTSPQESVSPQESLLQTPLPRKRPPVPMSRNARPNSRSGGSQPKHREQEKRVHFDKPARDFTPMGLYNERTSNKARRLLEEILGPNPSPSDEDKTASTPTMAVPCQDKRNALRPVHHQQSSLLVNNPKSYPRPLQTETATVIDDLGKIRTELQSVLTETERLKDDIATQKKLIKNPVVDQIDIRDSKPSPLDAYLVDTYGPKPLPRLDKGSLTGHSTAPIRHYADAERILRDVQARRETLETNLAAILRQREEEDLYALVDHLPQSEGAIDDTIRIKKEVDLKISKITAALQREIEEETKESQEKQEKGAPDLRNSKRKPARPVKPVPGNVIKRTEATATKRKGTKQAQPQGKENLPDKKPQKKPKITKNSSDTKPPVKQSAVTAAYLESVYGRSASYPHRTTSKAPYLHFQSPINPKTAAITSSLLEPGNRVPPKEVENLPAKTKNWENGGVNNKEGRFLAAKDRSSYYFHPAVDITGKGDNINVPVPVEGQLVPMAIPLGKPKTNIALRLPLNTQEAASEMVVTEATSISETMSEDPAKSPGSNHQAPFSHEQKTHSNVAVISVRSKDMKEHEENGSSRQVRRSARKKRSGVSLGVQVLPAVDIDSYTDTSDTFETPTREPCIPEITEPTTRPSDHEYDEFRSYLAVRDTGVQSTPASEVSEDEEKYEIPTPENAFTVQGQSHEEEPRPYNGPPFPPQHPAMSSAPPYEGRNGGVIEADTRQEELLQQRALEWVEQEILARIVSEMNQPLPDPTSSRRPPPATPESSSESLSEEDGDADMLAAAIGLGGIQLFVDAGVPVDRHLVNDLIRDVVAEKIATVLGYPKPTSKPQQDQVLQEEYDRPSPSPQHSPIPTPLPTPDYTPVASETSAEDRLAVATPIRTPTPSLSTLESESTSSDLKKQLAVETDKENTEKSESEVIEHSPLATPVPTPPRVQSPIVSVATPEPSLRDSVSEVETIISTPQPSVKTATPPPSSTSEPSVKSEASPKTSSHPVLHPTPSEPAVQVCSSPSTMTTSTLSTPGTTTTMTTEEEISEGELIQPNVHLGQYSEGEYAVTPGLVQIAATRDLPLDPQALWDKQVLGKDEDSRNDLIRDAVSGILQRGVLGRVKMEAGKDYRSSSSTASETTEHSTSFASTLRDTEDIKEDSVVSISHSEGELVLPKDPMAALLNRIQQHLAPVPLASPMTNSDGGKSVGEYPVTRPHLAQVSRRGARTVTWSEGEVVGKDATSSRAPGNLSPGEVFATTGEGGRSPGELLGSLEKGDSFTGSKSNQNGFESLRRPASRSLHHSDLNSSSSAQDSIHRILVQPKSVIQVRERKLSEHESDSDKSLASAEVKVGNGGKVVQDNAQFLGFSSFQNGDSQLGKETFETRPSVQNHLGNDGKSQQPTRIELTIPSMENLESSLASEACFDLEHDDTGGDVSSISGGDF